MGGSVGGSGGFHGIETSGVGGDVFAIDQVLSDEDVEDAVEQSDVTARLDGEVNIGEHRSLGDAGIDDDQGFGFILLKMPTEDGVVVSDVGTDEDDDIRDLHVCECAGRAIGAKAALVTGDSTGHAESGVSIVVIRFEAELD